MSIFSLFAFLWLVVRLYLFMYVLCFHYYPGYSKRSIFLSHLCTLNLNQTLAGFAILGLKAFIKQIPCMPWLMLERENEEQSTWLTLNTNAHLQNPPEHPKSQMPFSSSPFLSLPLSFPPPCSLSRCYSLDSEYRFQVLCACSWGFWMLLMDHARAMLSGVVHFYIGRSQIGRVFFKKIAPWSKHLPKPLQEPSALLGKSRSLRDDLEDTGTDAPFSFSFPATTMWVVFLPCTPMPHHFSFKWRVAGTGSQWCLRIKCPNYTVCLPPLPLKETSPGVLAHACNLRTLRGWTRGITSSSPAWGNLVT